jgi:hypothetical protein
VPGIEPEHMVSYLSACLWFFSLLTAFLIHLSILSTLMDLLHSAERILKSSLEYVS